MTKINFMICLDGTTYCRWVEMDQVPRTGDVIELGSSGWTELVESVRWNLFSGVVYVELQPVTDVHEEGLADVLVGTLWTAL